MSDGGPVAVVPVVGACSEWTVYATQGGGQIQHREATRVCDSPEVLKDRGPPPTRFVQTVPDPGQLDVAIVHLEAAGHVGHEEASIVRRRLAGQGTHEPGYPTPVAVDFGRRAGPTDVELVVGMSWAATVRG